MKSKLAVLFEDLLVMLGFIIVVSIWLGADAPAVGLFMFTK